MINTRQSLEIKIKTKYKVTIPNFYIEAGITQLNPFPSNLLIYLFSIFSSNSYFGETEERTLYHFTTNYYSDFLELNRVTVQKKFKKYIDSLKNFKYTEDFESWYYVFDDIQIIDTDLYVEVNKEFKEKYIQGCTKKAKPIYSSVDILTQLNQYEQKIYLMCRVFRQGGSRYKDNEFLKYLYQLGLYSTSSSHIYSKFTSRYIKPACEHISEITDIAIYPTFATKKEAENNKKVVSYIIEKNKKSIVFSNKDAWNNI